MRISLTCLVIFLLGPNCLQAQAPDEGAVKGTVLEPGPKGDQVPALDALVTAVADTDVKKQQRNPDGELPQRRSMPPEGKFTFPALRQDRWCFFAYKDGYDFYKSKFTDVHVRATVDSNPPYLLLKKSPPGQGVKSSQSNRATLVLVLYRRPRGPPPMPEDYQVDVNVKDELGRPVDGAFVSVLEYSKHNTLGHLSHGVTGQSGNHGNFNTGLLEQTGHREQYVVTASKYGFVSSIIVKGWVPRASVEVTLQKGQEVSETAGIETNEASHRKVFTGDAGRTIEALPLSGMRSFDLLSLLAEGVVPPPETIGSTGPSFAPGIGTAGSFVANGLRARENSFSIDGGDDNDELVGIRRQGFIVPTSQAVETIQEFEVISSLPDARFGRAVGGQVNIVTKPSTGGLHGSAYGFFTNRALSARNFFEGTTLGLPDQFPITTGSGVPVLLDGQAARVDNPSPALPPFSRAQTGATAGFNVRDTYMFLAAERLVQKGREEDHFAVPTVEQRGLFDSGASGLFVNGTPTVPSAVTGDAIFSLYPFPNDPLGPYGKNTFTEQLPADGNGLRTSVKADNRIRDFDGWLRFWGNYTRDSSVLGSTGGALDSSIKPKIQNYGFGMILSIAGQDQSHAFRLSGAGTVVSLDPYLAQVLSPSSNLILNVTQPGAGTVNYVSATSPMGKQILNSIGLNGVTQTSPVTGPLGQVTIAGFSSVGADTFSYPQKRNDLTAQIAYTGVVSKLGKIYSFGAEWRPRRLDTRLVPAIRPLISFSGLQNVSSGAISISTPSGVVDTAKISSTTMVAMGSPSGVLQTLADVRPPRNGLIPINSATLNQGSFFFQIERQISPQLRTISGIRVEVADAHDNSLPTLESTFNRQQLLGDAQDAETNCGSRCNGLAAATAQAFPANFKKFTEGNRFSLGPRLGFAWAAQSGRPWSLRGGFGLYTGQLQFLAANDARQAFNAIVPLNYANFSINSSQGTYLFNLANPAVQQLSPGLAALRSGSLNALTTNPFQLITQGIFDLSSIALQPTLSSLTLIEPNKALKNPYSLQYSITAETESRGFTFSLSYVGTRGSRLLRLTTPSGGVNRGSVRLDNASVLGSGFPIFQGQLLPPLNQTLIAESFSLAPTQYESVATSLYNSIQFEVRRLYSHGLQFSSALTYSRSFDDASDAIDLLGAYALPQNNENNSEWGPSNFDMPVRFVSSLVWDIAPKQRRIAFRGWQASGIGSVQNGQPFTVNSTFDINEDGNLTDRLKTDTGLTNPPGADSRTLLRLPAGVTTATFVANAGQNGTVGRNSFRGFGIANLDLALSKTFEISESRQFRVRCEAFNAFNSPHFGIPQRLLEAPAFGEAVRTISPARILQLSLKFNF